jgi:hypothetical protein
MIIRVLISIIAVSLFLLLPFWANAQSTTDVTDPEPTKYGVGFQSAFPAYGLSGMMDINEDISVQAIVGFFGSLKTFAARGLYNFQREDYWNLYGFGMLGVWNYSIGSVSETVPGFGLGAGISYDWRAFNADLPPLFWNLELGLGIVNFDEVNYNFSTFMFGAGVHYRF